LLYDAMNTYRLHFDRPVKKGAPFHATDDEAAKRSAEQRREGRACELWCGDRLIVRYRIDA